MVTAIVDTECTFRGQKIMLEMTFPDDGFSGVTKAMDAQKAEFKRQFKELVDKKLNTFDFSIPCQACGAKG